MKVVATACGPVFFVHGVQVKRNAHALFEQAALREQEGKLAEATGYLRQYLLLEPEDTDGEKAAPGIGVPKGGLECPTCGDRFPSQAALDEHLCDLEEEYRAGTTGRYSRDEFRIQHLPDTATQSHHQQGERQ